MRTVAQLGAHENVFRGVPSTISTTRQHEVTSDETLTGGIPELIQIVKSLGILANCAQLEAHASARPAHHLPRTLVESVTSV